MAVPDPVLRIEREGARVRVVLARPAVRNAFNAELIARLREAFTALGTDPEVGVVVLQGDGKTFCGGADVNWMRSSLELSEDDNVSDAAAMSDMLRAIDRCPKPVIARVHGAALAGGAGLCAVADAVVADEEAIFGFTETKLGLIPAVITPFVSVPGLLTAQCARNENGTYLAITVHGDPADPRIDEDRKSTRLNSSHLKLSRMPSSA